MLRRFFALTLTTLFLASCGKPESTASTNAQPQATTNRPITIAQFGHVFLYLPIYVAVNKGFFKDEGLDVTLVSTGGDEKTFAAVSSGNAQFGVADPVFTAVAREKGKGGKVVASVVKGVPFWVVTLKDEIKPFDTPEGFAGYKIGAYTAPSTSYAVMKMLLQNSGDPVKGTIVEGAFGTLLPMIKAKQADMEMDIEPMVSIAVKQGAHIVYSPASKLGDFAFTGLTVSDDFYKTDKKTIQSAVNAITRAMKYIHADFEGTVEVAAKEFSEVDKDVIESAVKHLIDEGTIPTDPLLGEEGWNNAIKLRKQIGDIKGEGAYAEHVDPSFAQAATK